MSPTDLEMSHADAATPKAARPRRSRRTPGSLYAFVVTLICVFLAGVMLAPPSPRLFLAEATVSLAESAEHTDAEVLARLRKKIVSDETLRQVLTELGPPPGASPELADNWPPYSEIQRLQAGVRIEPAGADTAAGRGVKLLVVDRDRDRALKTAEALGGAASHAQGSRQGGAVAVDPTTRKRMLELRSAENEARQALDAFLRKQFPTADEGSGKSGGEPEGVSSKKKPSRIKAGRRGGVAQATPDTAVTREQRFILAAYGVAAQRRLNPAWLALQRQLEQKEAERNELLERLTPLHPQVQKIDVEMSDIRRRQYKVPRYLDAGEAPATPTVPVPAGGPAETPYDRPTDPAVTPPGRRPTVDTPAIEWPGASSGNPGDAVRSPGENPASTSPYWQTDPQRQAVVAAQYEALRNNYEHARRQLDEAEMLAARIDDASPQAGPQAGQVRAVAAPRIVETYGGAPSGAALAIVGMLSVAAGVWVALSVRRATPAADVLRTPDDVSNALNLPLLGDLRRKVSAARKSPGRRRGRWACQAVRAAELLLAVFALAFLLVAMVDSPFLSEALSNPLAAVSQIMQRLTNLI
jgi:hypothetical protein